MTKNTLLLLIVACLGQMNCDRKKDKDVDSEVLSACDHFCGLRQDSDHESYGPCMDACVGADAQAEAVGPACVDAYRDLVACIGEFEGGEADAWVISRTWGSSEESDWICEGPSAAFLEVCPGVWYNE